MKAALRLAGALIGWGALALQFRIKLGAEPEKGLGLHLVEFLSYFTIETNILAALAMTAGLLAPGSWLDRPGLRGGLVVWLIVVGTVYHLVLAALWNPQGLHWWADMILHTAAPAIFVLDWLLFVPKGRLAPRHALIWLIFPAAFCAWSLARGAAAGWYPYPFIDAVELGYATVAMNAGGLLVAFAVLGLLVVGLDRVMGRASPR